MEEEESIFMTVMRIIVYGLVSFVCVIVVFNFNELLMRPVRQMFERKWILKHHFKRLLRRFFPSYSVEILTETDTTIPKVNCQALVLIENLPKCTTAKDLVKCLGLKEFVNVKKLMKVSVAADKKGNCAGLAVALVPRYCLLHSGILSKHNSSYSGTIIKVKEVKNRKLNLRKQLNWLSSDNWNQVGFRGRFEVYHNILQDFTTQYGYYLIDGGCFLQFYSDPDDVIVESASAGIDKIVMKMKNIDRMEKSELAWCKSYPGYIFTSVGVAPSSANQMDHSKVYNDIFAVLENKGKNKHIVAIGECGISVSSGAEKVKQKEIFLCQVKLASFFRKPLLVQASNDVTVDEILEVLKDFPDVTACLTIQHFTPSETAIKKWTNKGYYLGITGSLWAFQKETFWIPSLIKTVPLDRIIICSNGPSLHPNNIYNTKADFIAEIKKSEHFKNVSRQSIEVFEQDDDDESQKTMEPKGLCVVLELLASCVNKPPQALAQILNNNAERLYKFVFLDK